MLEMRWLEVIYIHLSVFFSMLYNNHLLLDCISTYQIICY